MMGVFLLWDDLGLECLILTCGIIYIKSILSKIPWILLFHKMVDHKGNYDRKALEFLRVLAKKIFLFGCSYRRERTSRRVCKSEWVSWDPCFSIFCITLVCSTFVIRICSHVLSSILIQLPPPFCCCSTESISLPEINKEESYQIEVVYAVLN